MRSSSGTSPAKPHALTAPTLKSDMTRSIFACALILTGLTACEPDASSARDSTPTSITPISSLPAAQASGQPPQAPASGDAPAADEPDKLDKSSEPTAGAKADPEPAPTAAPSGTLKLATWNIEWLHSEPGQGKKPRTEADYEVLKRYAKALDADVIAVQEIDGHKAIERVFDRADYSYHFETRASDQRVGLLVKKGLKVKRHPDLKALQVGSPRLRMGVDLTVTQGARSTRVLAVHLKSGCWGSPFKGPLRPGERADACEALKAQTPVLKAWADERRQERVPFVLMGDFNRRLANDDDLWRGIQADPKRPDLKAPTTSERSRCWGGKYPEYIDHIALSTQAASWQLPGSFKQLIYSKEDEREHKEALSDHCPISLIVRPR